MNINSMQVEPCNQMSNDHHTSIKQDDDWKAASKNQWSNTKHGKVNNFVIMTQNRFSHWEEDEIDEPVLSVIGELKTEKIKFQETIKKDRISDFPTLCNL